MNDANERLVNAVRKFFVAIDLDDEEDAKPFGGMGTINYLHDELPELKALSEALRQLDVGAELGLIDQRFTELVDLLERADCGPLLIATEFLRLSINCAASRMGRDWAVKTIREHADRVETTYAAS
jgi:hypothetical protein